MYTIYLIMNLVNGKVYVGQTSLGGIRRFREHMWSASKKDYFHNAVRLYGRGAFAVQDLATAESREQASALEQFYIVLFQSHSKHFGYNTTLGGECGAVPTEETRKKIGKASSLRRHSVETRAKMSQAHTGEKNHFFGRTHCPATVEAMRLKCRVALSGDKNPWYGKKLSSEHRLKISLAKKGKKMPLRSAETRRKLSEAATARWAKQKLANLTNSC